MTVLTTKQENKGKATKKEPKCNKAKQQNDATKYNKTTRQSYTTTHHAMTLSTDEVLARFVYKTLLIIDRQPTYADINKMSKILYANTVKVVTTLGGGNKGHIGLVMK
eukprot:13621809-Ditylum_brightwellii.AAC.1